MANSESKNRKRNFSSHHSPLATHHSQFAIRYSLSRHHPVGTEVPMKIVKLSAVPMSAPVPTEKRHRTDLGTKVKSDATLIRVETDDGLTGIGAALGSPPIAAAIVADEPGPEVVGEDPMFSERIYEKMYNGSRSTPPLARGGTQADEH